MENETDIEFDEEPESSKVTPEEASRAVVYTTDWTVETIISQLRAVHIDMPDFQRRDAWDITRKCRYIESLMLGLPVPQIVLAEKPKERGQFFVLDGKQRLMTLMQFIGFDEKSKYNKFKLHKLEIYDDLNGETYDSINKSETHADILNQFNNQTIRSIIIRAWPNSRFLQMLFIRLNRGSLSLSPQELRQALYPGSFTKYADKAAQDSAGLRKLLGNKNADKRMRDVELLVRYLALKLFLPEHPGSLKDFIDNTCQKLNKEWGSKRQLVEAETRNLESGLETAEKIFGEDCMCRRWLPKQNKYHPNINRAIYDIMAYYFSDENIRNAALQHTSEVVTAYQTLFNEGTKSNKEFISSVELSTNSKEATFTRLRKWGQALHKVLGVEVGIPVKPS